MLKNAYLQIRERLLKDKPVPKVAMAIDLRDPISWRGSGVQHHGVLMHAERGLSLRLPQILSIPETELVYRETLSRWIAQIIEIMSASPSRSLALKS